MSFFAYRCSKLLALAWQAEKRKTPVIMLSTQASAEIVTVQPSNTHLPPSTKPAVINLYNHNMNEVDVADQLGVYYSFQRKTLKWWRKVFFWLLEVTVVNSYITYKQIVINPKSHLAYRRTLIEVLAGRSITNAPPRPRIGRPRKRRHSDEADPERLNQKLHLLGKWEKQKDCVACSNQASGFRSRTYHHCKTYKENPTLHPDICFERYHTLHTGYKLVISSPTF